MIILAWLVAACILFYMTMVVRPRCDHQGLDGIWQQYKVSGNFYKNNIFQSVRIYTEVSLQLYNKVSVYFDTLFGLRYTFYVYLQTVHGKNYSQEEDDMRFCIFVERTKAIEIHQDLFAAGLVSYEMGLNQFSDLVRKYVYL